MTSVKVTVNEADLARVKLRLSSIARPALERIVQRAAPYAQRQAASEAPRATGALADSITARVSGLEMRVSSPLPYGLPVEFGRGAGTRMPPPDHFGGGLEGFLIARAIARRGIKGRFFLKRARQMLQTIEMPRLIKVAIDEIESEWAKK